MMARHRRDRGFWYTDFRVGGKRIREKLKGVKSRREAELAEAQMRLDLERKLTLGEFDADDPGLLIHLKDLLERDAQRIDISEGTRDQQREKTRILLSQLGTEARIGDLRPAAIEEYKRRRLEEGVSARTINIELVILRGALNRAVENEVIKKSPVKIRLLSEERREKRALTADEATRLVKAARENRDRRFGDVVEFMLNTGLRISETFALAWKDVDLEERTISVRTKKKGSTNVFYTDVLPLNDLAVRSLGRPGRGKVFATQHNFNRKLKWAARLAKIDRPGEVSAHTLRHTYCTLLGDVMVSVPDAQALMRHRSAEMTLRYMHKRGARMKAAVATLGEIWSPSGHQNRGRKSEEEEAE